MRRLILLSFLAFGSIGFQPTAVAQTCASIRCVAGTHCVDTASGGRCVPTVTCASMRCAAGTRCVDGATGGQCVRTATCATLQCAAGTRCVEGPTGPQCVPSPGGR
jgi:hypothetical protein